MMRTVKTGLTCAAIALLAAQVACSPARAPAGQESALALTAAAAAPAAKAGGEWGNVKGQAVWAGGAVPQRPKIDVTKDAPACLKNGPLFSDKIVVNPKNKGVRWVLVWLTDDDPKKALPVHPSLKGIAKKTVEIDQPCCMFEPHVVGLREGQALVFKNSAGIAHNVKVDGGAQGPNINPILPPGGKVEVKDIEAHRLPIPVSCSIHPWMKAYVGVYKGPYFTVTDENGNFEIKNAPAGKFRLIAWQEEQGWVAAEKGKAPTRQGQPIEIKPGETTDVKLEVKPSKD